MRISAAKTKKHLKMRCLKQIGGEAEIRTLGGVAPTTVFKTAALNRSATSPMFLRFLKDFLLKRM